MHGLPGTYQISGRSAVGSAVALGASGRRFDFCRPDHTRARPGDVDRSLVETGRKNWASPELVTGHHWSIGREVQDSGSLSHGRANGSFVSIPIFSTTITDPLTQWPECLPVQEEAKGSTPLRIANSHAEIAQMVERRVESASVADSILLSAPSFLTHFPPALAQLDQSTGLRSRGLHVRIVCAGPTTWSASSMGDCTGL